jgi:hypothetical protein
MNREEALEAVRIAVAEFEGRAHADLVGIIGTPHFREHVAASGRKYAVEVSACWNDAPNQVLRLWFSVDDGGWRRWLPLTKCGLVEPGATFDGVVE